MIGIGWPPAGYACPVGAYVSAVLADSPVAFWPLNEPSGTLVHDCSSSGVAWGTYEQVYTLNQPAIGSGLFPCVRFQTADGYVNIASTPAIAFTDATNVFSLECWVQFHSVSTQFFMEKGVSTGDSYYLWFKSGTGLGFGWNTGLGFQDHFFAWTPVINTTYHVVGTTDGTNAQGYINGAAIGAPVASGTGLKSSTFPIFGGASQNNGYPPTFQLDGCLSAMAVYPTALSAARVLAHYNAGK